MPVTFIGGGGAPALLYDIIQSLGLTTNQINCLDAADSRSYAGSGSALVDITGNGDFTANAGISWAGTLGDTTANTHFLFGGSDYISDDTDNVPDTAAWCLNNAIFSWCGLWYIPAGSGIRTLLGMRHDGNYGIDIRLDTTDHLEIRHVTNNGGTGSIDTSSLTIVEDAWNFIGLSANDTAGTLTCVVNGSSDTPAWTDSSRTTDTSSVWENTIGAWYDAIGSGIQSVTTGSKFVCQSMWDGTALSAAQFASIRAYINERIALG